MSFSENKSQMRASSERLSVALAADLMERLGHGSTLYRTTWKTHTTPSGRSLLRQRASARPISETDCTGWPSPCTPNGGRSVHPDKMDITGRTVDGKKHTASLEHAVKFVVGWNTPRATDGSNGGPNQAGGEYSDPELALARVQGPHANDLRDFAKLTDGGPSGWPTPVARDHMPAHTPEYIAEKVAQGHGMANLNDRAQLVGPARLTAHGTLLTGSGAGTVSGGQLNPDLSRWLMGLPEEWARSMPGWQDWQMWQVLTALASSEPKPTG